MKYEPTYTAEQATEDNEQGEELVKIFGNRFYNELGDRIFAIQKKKGAKLGKMDTEALQIAKQVIRDLYAEWLHGVETFSEGDVPVKGWWLEDKKTS